MDGTRLDDALESITLVRGSSELVGLITSLREIYQLAHLVYCGLRIPSLNEGQPYLVTTYPDEWVERYIREDFFRIDPVFLASRCAFLPVDWSTLDQQSPTARYIFAEAERYGIGRQGMSLPMRGPDGDSAAFTFTANVSADEWSAFHRRYTGELAIIGQHFHERVVRIFAGENGTKVRTSLSPRERECLQFLVDGQAPKQIAAILNLSEAAVRLYLKRARARLGAPTLMQAVIKALRANLITAH
jgi:DNA-binding CsgD family transcriptional regulator